MSSKEMKLLSDLAEKTGVQTSYTSAFGTICESSGDSLIAVLQALGLPLKNNLSNLTSLLAEESGNGQQPVHVSWGRRRPKLRLKAPRNHRERQVQASISGQNGEQEVLLKPGDDGWVQLPGELPYGYYDISLQSGKAHFSTLLIVAPEKSYEPRWLAEGCRALGVFTPVYSLFSRKDCGIGDLGDLGSLMSWAAGRGCSLTGTLPLFACYLDGPIYEPSPYSPMTRMFWNEIFLQTGISGVDSNQARELKDLRKDRLVDYKKAYHLKRQLLMEQCELFFNEKGDRTPDFQSFLNAEPLVQDYSRFRAIYEKSSKTWDEWPSRMQTGLFEKDDYDVANFNFHLYAQWLFNKQLKSTRQGAGEVRPNLYLDFPIGLHPRGFDTWRMPSSFAFGATAGCPPDRGHPEGQNWGIVPLHPSGIRKDGHAYFRACISKQMRYCDVLRLDHIMSLHRLYWVPSGFGPEEGVYVRYPLEELVAILSLESHKNKCVLIGEDLGTVPPEIIDAMKKHRILRMYVQQRALSADASRPFSDPPENSVAFFGTHDQPTFRGFQNCEDIKDKARLGHIGPAEVRNKSAQRRKLLETCSAFLRKKKLLHDSDMASRMKAFFRFLSRSNARLVMLNIEDLWLESQPQNTPTTSRERPNWRRKHRLAVERIITDKRIESLLKAFLKERQRR